MDMKAKALPQEVMPFDIATTGDSEKWAFADSILGTLGYSIPVKNDEPPIPTHDVSAGAVQESPSLPKTLPVPTERIVTAKTRQPCSKGKHSQKGMPFELQPQPEEGPFSQLTSREWEIFCYSVHGFTNYEIANKLGLHLGTVKNYRTSIAQKLKRINADDKYDNDRGELVHLAIEKGILALPVGEELDDLKRRYATLEPNEQRIMAMLRSGCDSKEIADKLSSTVGIVKNSRSSLMEKIHTKSLAGLIRAQLALDREEQQAPTTPAAVAADAPAEPASMTSTETVSTQAHPAAGSEELPTADAAAGRFAQRVQASRTQQARHWR